ncbi:MAG: hypothetical protein ACR2MD_01095 [Aridibacter sp.]
MRIPGSDTKIDIYFPERKKAGRRKGIFATQIEDDLFARRRKGGNFLNFYDLTSIKDGQGWKDQPILFTPAYTLTAGNTNAIIIEPFDTDDWQNYTDRFFEVPVENWADTYKPLTVEDIVPPYGLSLTSGDKPTSHDFDYYSDHEWIVNDYDLYQQYEQYFFENQGYSWTRDLLSAKFPSAVNWGFGGFRPAPFDSNQVTRWNWYNANTDHEDYKVTDVRDYTAAAVDLTLSGKCDVYLMPKIGLFLGGTVVSTTTSLTNSNGELLTETKTENYILGLQFQINPREKYPQPQNPYYGTLTYAQRLNNYLVYNKQVPDRRCIKTTRYSYKFWDNTTPRKPTTIEEVSPLSFPENGRFRLYQAFASHIDYEQVFSVYVNNTLTNSYAWFYNNNPQLTAVIKKGGIFYYIWDMTDFGGGSKRTTVDSYQKQRGDFDARTDPYP